MTTSEPAPLVAPTAGKRRSPGDRQRLSRLLFAFAVLAAGVLAFITLRRQVPEPVGQSPYEVSGDHIAIAKDAPTWGYIRLATAALGDPVPLEPVSARVAFDEARSMPIVAPLTGRVESVEVRLGQEVQSGDRLLAVRSAALVDLAKEIELVRAEENARRKTVDRLRSLVELRAAAEKDLLAAEEDLRQSQLAREAAEVKLRSLSLAPGDEGHYWLTAPRAGAVVERNVLIGQEVGPDRSDPLLVIADLAEVIVTADVPEASVPGLQVGEAATVVSSALADRQLSGRVEYIGQVVDPVRRMVNVRVRLANPDRALRPNAFVQVVFATTGQTHVVVDADAVVTDDQQSFVFVQTPGHPEGLQRRAVVPGHQHEGTVEILSGLQPGETYAAKGAILLLNALDLASQ